MYHSLKTITFVCLEKWPIISFSLFSSVLCHQGTAGSVTPHRVCQGKNHGWVGQGYWQLGTNPVAASLGYELKAVQVVWGPGSWEGDWSPWKPGQEQPELWFPSGALINCNFVCNNYSVWEIASCAFQKREKLRSPESCDLSAVVGIFVYELNSDFYQCGLNKEMYFYSLAGQKELWRC